MSKDADYHRTFGSGRAREERVDELTRKARLMPQHVKRGFDQRLEALRPKVKSYEAFQYLGEATNLSPIHIHVRPDQDFWQSATDWERTFSTLCWTSTRQAVPVVDERLTVVGHFGVFRATSIFVRKEAPQRIIGFDGALASGEPAFVTTAVPSLSHYRTIDCKFSFYEVLVSPDGAVNYIKFDGNSTENAIEPSFSPLDLGRLGLVIARVAFTTARGGARYLFKSIELKVRRRGVGAGPTKELAEQAAREAARKATGGATRELAAPSDLAFAKGKPLPKPEKPDTVYRIMSPDEGAKTAANKKLPPPIRGAEGERFVSIDSKYPALFREEALAKIEHRFARQLKKELEDELNIRNRMAELAKLKKCGDAAAADKLKALEARLQKLEAEHKQRGIARKAEADAVIKEWHAMPGQQVVVEIELAPGTLDAMLRKSVDISKWGQYSRSEKDVFLWKLERGYGRNIGIPKWQIEAFNKSIVKVRLHAYKQPLGTAGLPKPSGYGPN